MDFYPTDNIIHAWHTWQPDIAESKASELRAAGYPASKADTLPVGGWGVALRFNLRGQPTHWMSNRPAHPPPWSQSGSRRQRQSPV